MFSNKHRVLKMVSAAILACCLAALYAVQAHNRDISMAKAFANPELYNGRTITRAMSKVVTVEGNTLTIVEKNRFYTAVVLPGILTKPIKAGQRVSLSGEFRDGVLWVNRYHLHTYRKAKILISLGVLLLLAGYTWLTRARWLPWLEGYHSSR